MTFLYTVANDGSDYERNLCESKDMFLSSFVIINFMVMVFLAALDSWILVALRWWNEQGESVSQSLARLNMKDSWLVWWTLFLNVHAAAWVILGIFSIKRFEADYVLVVAVCGSLSIANIAGFTKCRKDAKKQIQGFASQALASHFTSSIPSAPGAV
ncbi:PREDICTED: Golgi apparatus membrane protein-like protein ECHIDNA isoform X5 [Populus euphratica]|uniref:Golgi apparatus membrane protein TVP23 n=1 Tax=Populus euphratica TaxID=75702 RepID=A0AAJ6Y341_POPEU|nr:PREDICTED: Golgi apparatus membrane protein-like protein ECHIDNA isoform X5 [Populus euphratica]